MINQKIITDSIECYHTKIALETPDLLTLYRYGSEDRHEKLSQIQTLKGYKETLVRYLVDDSVLTIEQLLSIITLCPYPQEQQAVVVLYMDPPFITYVPPPVMVIDVETIAIRLIETPMPGITVLPVITLISVPAPAVTINDKVGVLLTFVPPPVVVVTPAVVEILLTGVPSPSISYEEDDLDSLRDAIAAEDILLTGVPMPGVKYADEDDQEPVLEFVPPPAIDIDVQTHDGDVYFFGIVPSSTSRPTAADINFEELSKVILSSTVPDDLHILYPNEKGWAVFAIPDETLKRQSYYISDQNKGVIGGSPDGVSANLWPDAEVVVYDTKPFKVYISSYLTRIERAVTVRAAIYNPRYQSGVLPIE